MTRSADIVVVQSAWPPYRQQFVDEFLRRLGKRVVIVSGDRQFAVGVRRGIDVPSQQWREVANRFFFGNSALWQSSAMRHTIFPTVVVLELNPRILNTWLVLVVRRALGRPTILWGHAWPRSGPNSWTDRVRHAQRRLADALLVYTVVDADGLQRAGVRKPVFAAPNALYRRQTMGSNKPSAPPEIIFSGRLVPDKKPGLLLEAFIAARIERDHPLSASAVLSFVGSGPLQEFLMRRAVEAGIQQRVHFHGSVWDPGQLRQLYDRAFVAVSSGYAGLNVVQASSFGTPIVVADAEPHAPEIAYLEPGLNGDWFHANSREDLARALLHQWRHRAAARARAEGILSWARDNCSVEAMVDGFISAIDEVSDGCG